MLILGTSKLDHILPLGKPNRDVRGLDFVDEMFGFKILFVKGFDPTNVTKTTNVATNSKTLINFDPKGKKFFPICYFCDVKGRIRPRCFTMMNFVENHYMIPFQRKTHRPKVELKNKPRKVWSKKSNVNCFVAFTCLRTCTTYSWYFDSGCSKHMTGNQNILTYYKSISSGRVTFGDGVQG